ncbi:MAG: 2OG-Fe(II) oxygenase [Acetobacteraceae bacterium]
MTPPDLSGLETDGLAVLPGLLDPAACARIAALWEEPAQFRKQVVMGAHGYGQGAYRYFADPLPAPVAALRETLYPPLAAAANRWAAALGRDARFPPDHAAYRARCHAAGQRRPTPLLLRYGPGDYNRLHQDLYGEEWFPFQLVLLLSAPGRDFTGGELVLTEQRARMQSRVEVVPLGQGDAAVFAVRDRPIAGARGVARAVMRHGVSRVRTGERMTVGVIFHDAA